MPFLQTYPSLRAASLDPFAADAGWPLPGFIACNRATFQINVELT